MIHNAKNQELFELKGIVFSTFAQIEEKIDRRIPNSFCNILILFLSIRGKINFLQLARFSEKCEQRFRYFFEQSFDFLSFNKVLLSTHLKGATAIAFDPSYISKSGKKTPGVGYFWSGCAGATKWGLELCGVAALDLLRKTAFHLTSFQTVELKDNETLISFYVRKLLEQKAQLLALSKYWVADAYFSKITFINPMTMAGFHVVSRLRDDANMQYLFTGEQSKGKGRKKKFDGKVNYQNLEVKHATLVSEVDGEKIYWLKARHKTLKRTINTVIVYTTIKKGILSHKIYFSTDLTQHWQQILKMYRLRFQIEFLYRDAKQFTGLNDCQARSKNKLDFHWNMALTAINVAKIVYWIPKKDSNTKEEVAFSMSDVKTLFNNQMMLDRFIKMFGVNTKLLKNKYIINKFLRFGKIAA